MQEIKCPKCGTVFQVEEAGYAEILRQVRDKEFENTPFSSFITPEILLRAGFVLLLQAQTLLS